MQQPFARAALVLAVLICMITVHGAHSDDAHGHVGAAPVAAAGGHDSDDIVSASAHRTAEPEATGADSHHDPHGDSCDTASGPSRILTVVAPPTAVTTTAHPGIDGDTPAVGSPAVKGGRELLLLRCVHRT